MTAFANSNRLKLVAWDSMLSMLRWAKNGKILNFLIDVLFAFFCRKSVKKKTIYPKKVGATDHLRKLNLSKVNATATIPL